jgi:predicted deacylase
MITTILSVDLPIDEKLQIKKNTIYGKGKSSTKRFCLTSGIHGDELEGQLVCYEVNKRLSENLQCLNGTVDIYPALNPLGIDSITRVIPAFDIDMNKMFPGEADGTMVEYITAEILKDMKGADFALNIHASNIFIREIPQVRIPLKYSESLKPLCKLLNMDLVWAHDSSSVKESSLSYTLNELGTPSAVIDMGIGMSCTKEYCAQLTDGIFCLLKELGMWEGPTITPRKPLYSDKNEDIEYVRAEDAGVFVKEISCGDRVEADTVIGKIINPLEGVVKHEVKAGAKGYVFTLREYPIVESGSLLGRILK